MLTQDKADFIYNTLKAMFKDARIELKFNNQIRLLAAVILSAQCTDTRVNIVTESLFKKYKTAADFAGADLKTFEQEIKSCGFYHNKAKHIIDACKIIERDFGGQLPGTLDDLLTLSGVGRKIANVLLSQAFNKPAIAVDTHIFRVSNRLGLSGGSTPDKVEQDLMKQYDQSVWGELHLLLLFFGRYQCKAIKPMCESCEFKGFCKYYNDEVRGKS